MVGIFPNLYNFHKSDAEFKKVFSIINKEIPISELKANEIYRGRKSWKRIDPKLRDKVIEYYFSWVTKRNHKFIITAIDNNKFFKRKKADKNNTFFKVFPYPWLLSAFHIALVIQKCNRAKSSNKGKTILIFDEEDPFEGNLCDLIFNPPDFIDEFVKFNKKKEKERLNQLIDSAYFVKSHHSSMAQVVDILAYFYRLYLELYFYGSTESYDGEKKKIEKWISKVKHKFLPYKSVYPKGNSPFLDFINSMKAEGVSW
jgi:hypothetical protein